MEPRERAIRRRKRGIESCLQSRGIKGINPGRFSANFQEREEDDDVTADVNNSSSFLFIISVKSNH